MNDNKQCSQLFEDVFDSHCGGCIRECSCGTTYFDTSDNGWDWEKGELEELVEKSKKYPIKFIETSGTVYCLDVNGEEIVIGCTCNKAKRYEDFIVSNAEKIAEYLNKRAKLMREKADKMVVNSTKIEIK